MKQIADFNYFYCMVTDAALELRATLAGCPAKPLLFNGNGDLARIYRLRMRPMEVIANK